VGYGGRGYSPIPSRGAFDRFWLIPKGICSYSRLASFCPATLSPLCGLCCKNQSTIPGRPHPSASSRIAPPRDIASGWVRLPLPSRPVLLAYTPPTILYLLCPLSPSSRPPTLYVLTAVRRMPSTADPLPEKAQLARDLLASCFPSLAVPLTPPFLPATFCRCRASRPLPSFSSFPGAPTSIHTSPVFYRPPPRTHPSCPTVSQFFLSHGGNVFAHPHSILLASPLSTFSRLDA